MPRARTGAVRQCGECGKDMYLSPRELPRRKFCSRTCQSAFIAKATSKECARCGVPYSKSPSVVGRYCSWTCYSAGRQKRETCAVCNSPLKSYQVTYCSHECRDEGRTTLEARPCEICGRPMQVQPHQFGKRRVCSRACNDELKRRQPKKEGGRYKRADGYIEIYLPSHPDAKGGRVMEHRLIMEQKIGRRLLQTESVNHINHVRDDNRPENLEILSPGDHARESNAFGKAHRKSIRDRLAAYEAKYGPLD